LLLKGISGEMGIDVMLFSIRMTTFLTKDFKSLIIFLEKPDEI
tara:strand:- start:1 stop:129 length:129 start_codon:yes stop_codon:yes gene_type:complete